MPYPDVPTQTLLRAPDPVLTLFQVTLKKKQTNPTWTSAVRTAGEVAHDSLVLKVDESKLSPHPESGEHFCYLAHFDCFRSGRRFEAVAERKGWRHAHPRLMFGIAQEYYDLPLRIKVQSPMMLVTLVPCYKFMGEQYGISVWWDKELKRTVKGVPLSAGWEPEYWVCFESSE